MVIDAPVLMKALENYLIPYKLPDTLNVDKRFFVGLHANSSLITSCPK